MGNGPIWHVSIPRPLSHPLIPEGGFLLLLEGKSWVEDLLDTLAESWLALSSPDKGTRLRAQGVHSKAS